MSIGIKNNKKDKKSNGVTQGKKINRLVYT